MRRTIHPTASIEAGVELGPEIAVSERVRVRQGAALGAQCRIDSAVEVGRYAVVEAGAVVTRSVPDYHQARGNPARSVAYVCRCRQPMMRFEPGDPLDCEEILCADCGRIYAAGGGRVVELSRPL